MAPLSYYSSNLSLIALEAMRLLVPVLSSSSFYKRICTFRRTFFDMIGNVDEIMQSQHLNQYIYIYLHRECRKSSFIRCFIMTAENSI